MENALIFKKEVGIELMKFQHDVLLLEESDYIDSFNDDYYMESSDVKAEGFFEKLVKKVRDLIKKIKDKISEAFSKEKVKKEQEKFKLKIQQDPSYKNKKVKVVVNDKVIALDKKAITELSKCKTVEEAEKYVSNYKKKRQMLTAGAVVSVSAIAAIGMLGNKLHKSHQQLDEVQGLYESSMKDLEKQKASRDAEIVRLRNKLNNATDKVHEMKKREVQLINEKNKESAKYKNRSSLTDIYRDNVWSIMNNAYFAQAASENFAIDGEDLSTNDKRLRYISLKLSEIIKSVSTAISSDYDMTDSIVM